jgi:hypothetical protein
VRLIGEEKEMMGVCTREEALKAADEAGLDLVRTQHNTHAKSAFRSQDRALRLRTRDTQTRARADVARGAWRR